MENITSQINHLKNWFKQHTKVLIAFSGGVDSCLVTYMARKVLGKENAVAVISNSASLKAKDLKDAQNFAVKYDIQLIEIDANEINDFNYSSNPVNRCYYCKSHLYNSIQKLITITYNDFKIVNGNNFDDLGDYRPGMQAADEYKVFSPLLECKINKVSVREISKYYNLELWDKPASPCLSSRFPYGEEITRDKLLKVEKAENLLNTQGFKDVRVRYKNGNASIEVPHLEIHKLKLVLTKQIKQKITGYGFDNLKIDEEGLVSGKLNREIIK